MTPTVIPPGVSGQELVNFLSMFSGQEYIIALFLGCALVGAMLGLITRRGRRF